MHHRLHDKGGSAARGSTSGVRSASGGFAYRRGFLYPRGLGRPPPPEIHGLLRNTVHKRSVRILLECFLL